MHHGIGFLAIVSAIAFVFGETAARVFVGGCLVLAAAGIVAVGMLIVLDKI